MAGRRRLKARPYRTSDTSFFRHFCRAAVAACLLSAAHGQMYVSPSLQDTDFEPNSPQELLPGTLEPGLPLRAVPALPPNPAPKSPKEGGFTQFNRFTNILDTPPLEYVPPPDPSSFRPVIVNAPPVGLHPRYYPDQLLLLFPWFGLQQSYESNVNLTSTGHIADFYITPQAGLELQLGTPDSVYTPGYDTIFALHMNYQAYADLFFEHPDFSAFDEKIDLNMRIGRSSAIWRPFFNASDITGSNTLLTELVNRTRRITVTPGMFAEYKFTELIGWNQTFSYNYFNHTDKQYINTENARTEQEATYKFLNDTKAIVWGEYRYTIPGIGSTANEYMAGVGWAGKPDPRLYTELRIGWDFMNVSGYVPGRFNKSGIRFHGYTTFDWGPRFRFTLRYDRDYVFNEIQPNNNYVSTLLQVKAEIFLGANWYITPYFGCSYQQFETSHDSTIQWRPELEISYALPNEFMPNEPRVFAKIAYMYSQNLQGSPLPIEDWRLSFGVDWKF